MCGADVIYETSFGNKVLSTRICCVEVANVGMITEIEGAADESFAHMRSADVNLEISWLGEPLIAAKIGAGYPLSFLQRLPRMLTVDMVLQLSLARALEVAERTISVFFFDMGLKLGLCGKTEVDRCFLWAKGSWNCALRAEELGSSMYTLFVLPQTYCSIKSSITGLACDGIDVGTGIRCKLEVFGADMPLQGLMLSEGLVARWVRCAPESIMPFVCFLVPLQAGRRKKTLVATLPIAVV